MSEDQSTDIFEKRLKSARLLRGLSQTDLAAKAGLPPSSVSHFESGTRKPSFENLKRLANALNVTTDYLLGRANETDGSAAVGTLHRDLNKLSDADIKLTEDFVKLLLGRGGQD
jgi:transcriptional regulator with XRE-family HTH domain